MLRVHVVWLLGRFWDGRLGMWHLDGVWVWLLLRLPHPFFSWHMQGRLEQYLHELQRLPKSVAIPTIPTTTVARRMRRHG